jgi:RHS repeat-associated protein
LNINHCEKDSYGQPTVWNYNLSQTKSCSDYGNNFLFTGREVDILDNGSLKIQYNRNRSYDYSTGRWLQRDPIGYVDGMNLYQYVKSNPIRLMDPLGLECPPDCAPTLPVDPVEPPTLPIPLPSPFPPPNWPPPLLPVLPSPVPEPFPSPPRISPKPVPPKPGPGEECVWEFWKNIWELVREVLVKDTYPIPAPCKDGKGSEFCIPSTGPIKDELWPIPPKSPPVVTAPCNCIYWQYELSKEK